MEDFKNSSKSWSVEEDIKLNKLYNDASLDIMKISQMHGRTPGAIISRLVKNKHVTKRELARGYKKYVNSDLYKEIVSKNKEKKKKKEEERRDNVEEIKKDVEEIKNSIKELVDLMKSVYKIKLNA